MASLSKDIDSSPIKIDLVVEEADKRTTTLRTGAYKPIACAKTCKCQRKLTSTVWANFTLLELDEEGNLWCKCKKRGLVYNGDSKHGTHNLK